MTSTSVLVSSLGECFDLGLQDPAPKCPSVAPSSAFPFFYPATGYAMYQHDGAGGYSSSYSTLQGWAGAGHGGEGGVGPPVMTPLQPIIVPDFTTNTISSPTPITDEHVLSSPYASYSLRAAVATPKVSYHQQPPYYTAAAVSPHHTSFGLGLGLSPWVEPMGPFV
jgi:hypothetical protein